GVRSSALHRTHDVSDRMDCSGVYASVSRHEPKLGGGTRGIGPHRRRDSGPSTARTENAVSIAERSTAPHG
ncbi:MAG: hypothetical protein M3440_00820, partial [Chloroflexota bacterium]|nr:hypothetical protein [Chloroflexota bacterium]